MKLFLAIVLLSVGFTALSQEVETVDPTKAFMLAQQKEVRECFDEVNDLDGDFEVFDLTVDRNEKVIQPDFPEIKIVTNTYVFSGLLVQGDILAGDADLTIVETIDIDFGRGEGDEARYSYSCTVKKDIR